MKSILRHTGLIQISLVSLGLMIFLAACIERREQTYGEPDQAADTTQAVARDSLVIELPGADSMTVFDLLKQKHEVEFQESSMGVFVQAIDSIANSERIYWLYSVNDSMGQVACDQYVTREGDIVRWHYRKMGE